MKCKFCGAELESNSSVCPKCSKDNLKDGLKGLKITALVLVCLVMLVLLAGLVCYGVTGSFVPNFGGNADSTDPTGTTTGTATVTDYTVTTVNGTETMSVADFNAAMDTVVATMGEHELTNRQLQMYYWMVAYTYGENADFTKPMIEQVYDETTGQTYHAYFLEKAFDAWKELVILADVAADADYELPEDYASYLDGMEEELYTYAVYYYGLSSVDEMVQMQFGPGCNYEAYYQYAHDYYYGGLYWSDTIDDYEVTEDEINAYFEENEESLANDYTLSITKDFGNLIDIRNILFAVGEDTEEAWAECLAKAQNVYDLYLAGEQTEEAFSALATEHSEDTGSAADGGLYTDMYKTGMAEVDVRHILIKPADSSSEDSWAEAKTNAEAILQEWLDGEATEEAFAELANSKSEDTGSNTAGGLYSDIYQGQMVTEFDAWCFDSNRQYGDYGIVKTSYGYHIMFYVHGDVEVDNWVSAQERQIGDVALLKMDDGYQIIYISDAEPAWYRYSRYGAQAAKAQEVLDGLMEENAAELDETIVVIGTIS